MSHLLHSIKLEHLDLKSKGVGGRYEAGLPEKLVVLSAQAPAVVDLDYELLGPLNDVVKKRLNRPVPEPEGALDYAVPSEYEAEVLGDHLIVKVAQVTLLHRDFGFNILDYKIAIGKPVSLGRRHGIFLNSQEPDLLGKSLETVD